MDTWMGNSSDPITLHKYLYAGNDPVNKIDPTGKFSMGEFSAAQSVSGFINSLGAAVIYSSQLNSFTYMVDEEAIVETQRQRTTLDIAIAKAKAKTCVLGREQCKLPIPAVFFGNNMWEASAHYRDAQVLRNLPAVLSRSNGHQGSRQWYRGLGFPECIGRGISQQCDEYPFYSTEQGGPQNYPTGVSLRLINGIHNGAAGVLLESMFTTCGVRASDSVKKWFVAVPIPSGQSGFSCSTTF